MSCEDLSLSTELIPTKIVLIILEKTLALSLSHKWERDRARVRSLESKTSEEYFGGLILENLSA